MRTLIIALLLIPLAAQAGPACPTAFTEFLALFEKNIKFQTRNTRFPLHYTFVDGNAQPEPKPIKVMVTRTNVSKYPGIKYPSPATQNTVPLQRNMSLGADGKQIVKFNKPDSDAYSVAFSFTRGASCWQLVEVENGSL